MRSQLTWKLNKIIQARRRVLDPGVDPALRTASTVIWFIHGEIIILFCFGINFGSLVLYAQTLLNSIIQPLVYRVVYLLCIRERVEN